VEIDEGHGIQLRFDGVLTIGGVFERLPEGPAEWPDVQGPIERAVLDLLARRESAAIERIEKEPPSG
jgi:hypothetical protein